VRSRQSYLIVGVITTTASIGLIVAPTAVAACNNSAGTTICAQGSVSGSDLPASSSGPYYPYPCEYDWLCDDGGLSIAINPPDRPNRPGGDGGGIRPR
jgi:hypothetical protein